jgi:integrase
VAVRKGRKRFFIPFSKTAPREVATGTIYSWIITMAYEAGKEECRKGKAHDTRSMAASWALSKSVPLADIMSAAGWSSESTPRQHYLHEIQDPTDALHCVAVHTVL